MALARQQKAGPGLTDGGFPLMCDLASPRHRLSLSEIGSTVRAFHQQLISRSGHMRGLRTASLPTPVSLPARGDGV
jgi:hypothetical protein